MHMEHSLERVLADLHYDTSLCYRKLHTLSKHPEKNKKLIHTEKQLIKEKRGDTVKLERMLAKCNGNTASTKSKK